MLLQAGQARPIEGFWVGMTTVPIIQMRKTRHRECCASGNAAQLAGKAAGFTPRQSDVSSHTLDHCTVLPLDVGKKGQQVRVLEKGGCGARAQMRRHL